MIIIRFSIFNDMALIWYKIPLWMTKSHFESFEIEIDGVTGAGAISKLAFRVRFSAGKAYCKRNFSKTTYKYLLLAEIVPAVEKMPPNTGSIVLCTEPSGSARSKGGASTAPDPFSSEPTV